MLCPSCKGFTTPREDKNLCHNLDCEQYGRDVTTNKVFFPATAEMVELLRDCHDGKITVHDKEVHPMTESAFAPPYNTHMDTALPPMNEQSKKDAEVVSQGGTQFETGAVRSADRAGVMYHLITPIGLRRLAEFIDKELMVENSPIDDCSIEEIVGCASEAIFAYLNEGKGYPTCDNLAVAAYNLLHFMHIQETGYVHTIHEFGKGGWALIPPAGLRRVAETYREGFDKYGAFNWERGMPIGDILNHAIAHIYAYLSGEPTGEDDLAHAAWNVLAAMHMEETHPHLNHQLRFA